MYEESQWRVHTFTEHRILSGLKYLILQDQDDYPKSDHENASGDAIVNKRVKIKNNYYYRTKTDKY